MFGGGAGEDADGGAVQFLGIFNPEFVGNEKALAVVVIDLSKVESEIGVTGKGLGGVAGQDVNLAGLQGGETGFWR